MRVVQPLQTAVAYHQAGNYPAAEQLYQQVLLSQPANPDALHLLGLLKYQTGDAQTAVGLIEQAIRSNPNVADFHNNCGEAYRTLGRLKEAERCYQQAIKLNPQHVMAHNNLALVLMDGNKLDQAAKHLKLAQRISPNYVEATYNLAQVCFLQGKFDSAKDQLSKVLNLNPGFYPALVQCAAVCEAMGDYAQAMGYFDQALAMDPSDIVVMNSKGLALIKAGRPDEAVQCFQHLLSQNWKLPEVYCNLGVAQHQLDQLADARDAFEQALRLKADYFEPQRNLASLLRDLGDIQASIKAFERLIARYPEKADLHFGLAFSLLLYGDYTRGWQEYEWRWASANSPSPKPTLKGKEWQGESLNNKTMLVYCEQGAGDAIQFARFIPMLNAQGLRTIVQCPDSLIPLFTHLKGVDQVVSVNQKAKGFDVHCPIMSLPLHLGITLDNIPADVPYLSVETGPVDAIPLSSGQYHIGVVWAGSALHFNDRKRSCHAELFRSLAELDGVQLHCLQKLDKDAAAPDFMVDHSALLTHYGDTAALINKLDLVITVDTSVAHLAGALGKPVWILLAHAPDWRWQQQGDRTPWYPTAQLFRQLSPGDWQGVIAQVKHALSLSLGSDQVAR